MLASEARNTCEFVAYHSRNHRATHRFNEKTHSESQEEENETKAVSNSRLPQLTVSALAASLWSKIRLETDTRHDGAASRYMYSAFQHFLFEGDPAAEENDSLCNDLYGNSFAPSFAIQNLVKFVSKVRALLSAPAVPC